MKLHNTLTRSVDQFTPLNEGRVDLYACGPTVYDELTIGNWTAYIRWDILARSLKQQYDLNWYINITDVGHLVSDGDEGEDKLEKGAKREGKTAWEIAEQYAKNFYEGLRELNICIEPDHLIKATDHIDEQIALIKKLEEKGYTYLIEDGVYFDSTKFADYGKMARLDIAGLQAGARVEVGDKKHPTDFALWKLTPAGQKRDMEWDSPWGKGFPGWHIECSAMAMKYLGETIDIHTGGIDHIPVHHTNEIAQSEAATGKQFVRYWLHSNFLKIDGSKIAKKLGNGCTLKDLQAKGFSGQDFRMFTLQSHYQTESNFTWEGLEAAKNRLSDLQAVADLRFQPSSEAEDQSASLEAAKQATKQALEENLNTPVVLSELSKLTSLLEANGLNPKNAQQFEDFLKWLDQTLGFELSNSKDITPEQKQLIKRRSQARKGQNWELSDQIRNQLLEESIGLNDTARSTVWRRL